MKDAALAAATEAASEVLAEDLGIFAEAPDQGEQPEQEAESTTYNSSEEFVASLEEPEIPEDILALVETPDFEAEAEAEVESYLAHEAEEATLDDDYENEWDPEKKKLLKALRAAEKKAEFYETKRVEAEQGKWKDEAEKYFPYADTTQIKATSRRGFLRAAKEQHEAKKTEVASVEARIRPKVEAQIAADLRAQIEAEVRAELKEQAAQAWGSPTVNVTTAQQGISNDENFDKVLKARGLAAALRTTIKTK